MKTSQLLRPQCIVLWVACFVVFLGFSFAIASDVGTMGLEISGLNPSVSTLPTLALYRKTAGGLESLSAVSEELNVKAGAVERRLLHNHVSGLKFYQLDLPRLLSVLPLGDYYLYVELDGFEVSRDFSIVKDRVTEVELIFSHLELRAPQCGFYDSDEVTFQVFIPQGPPVYRRQIPCDSRTIITLDPGDYEGVVTGEDQKRRAFSFAVQRGRVTPVEILFP